MLELTDRYFKAPVCTKLKALSGNLEFIIAYRKL